MICYEDKTWCRTENCILVMGVPPEGIAYWKKRIWPFAAKRLSTKLPLKD